jgi:hypothetical protein
LERANEVRLARAELKRRIAQGRVSAARIILDSPWEASSWAVADLLMSQRRWGGQRCRKFLAGSGISERKEIGKLTERQRRLLAAELMGRSAPELELIGPEPEVTLIDTPTPMVIVAAPPEMELVPV